VVPALLSGNCGRFERPEIFLVESIFNNFFLLPCCATPENMRSPYRFSDRAAHELRHNSPGMWLEAPKKDRKNRFYCSKCPGAFGAGMIDVVKAPTVLKTTAGARRFRVCSHKETCAAWFGTTQNPHSQQKDSRVANRTRNKGCVTFDPPYWM